MARTFFLALGLFLMTSISPAEWVYFGTGDTALYVSKFDPKTGSLSEPRAVAEISRPNFLEIRPDGRRMYVCSREPANGPDARGVVIAFAIDPKTGDIERLNSLDTGAPGPAHVTVDQTGRMVVVANYTGGSIAAFKLAKDGRLAQRTALIQHEGSSVNKRRQSEAHAHSVNFSPDNRVVVAADLGLDKLMLYDADPATGKLTPNDPPFATVAPGSGPRHFAFRPDGKFGYVINEMASTITAFRYDAATSALSEIQTISTLPEGFKGDNTTAEVQVHPDGKFLYGSNRGHDSIAVFSIDHASGKLTPVEIEPTQGKTPRNFRMDPSGRYLFAANQQSNSVVVFRVDATTGKLTPTGVSVEVPSPMCVRFVANR
ncbi:MAG: lactonase family protein [Bryobacterales bacterium]